LRGLDDVDERVGANAIVRRRTGRRRSNRAAQAGIRRSCASMPMIGSSSDAPGLAAVRAEVKTS
jgi:hypothetical protein